MTPKLRFIAQAILVAVAAACFFLITGAPLSSAPVGVVVADGLVGIAPRCGVSVHISGVQGLADPG